LNQTAPSRARWRRFFLAAAFLYLGLLGAARVQQSLIDWDLLLELGVRPGPLYLAVSGALWGVLGLAAALLAYVRRRWAGRTVFAIGLIFTLSYWADFLAFTRAAEMMTNWPFALGASLLGLLYCAWAAGLLAPGQV
jgi:hypothetical protein